MLHFGYGPSWHLTLTYIYLEFDSSCSLHGRWHTCIIINQIAIIWNKHQVDEKNIKLKLDTELDIKLKSDLNSYHTGPHNKTYLLTLLFSDLKPSLTYLAARTVTDTATHRVVYTLTSSSYPTHILKGRIESHLLLRFHTTRQWLLLVKEYVIHFVDISSRAHFHT